MVSVFSSLQPALMFPAVSGPVVLLPDSPTDLERGATDVLCPESEVITSAFVQTPENLVVYHGERFFRPPLRHALHAQDMWCASAATEDQGSESVRELSPVVADSVSMPVTQFDPLEVVLAKETIRTFNKMKKTFPADVHDLYLHSLLYYHACCEEQSLAQRIKGVQASADSLTDREFAKKLIKVLKELKDKCTPQMRQELHARLVMAELMARAGAEVFFLSQIKDAQLCDSVAGLGLSEKTILALKSRRVIDDQTCLSQLFSWQTKDLRQLRTARDDVKAEWKIAVEAVKKRFGPEYSAARLEEWGALQAWREPLREEYLDVEAGEIQEPVEPDFAEASSIEEQVIKPVLVEAEETGLAQEAVPLPSLELEKEYSQELVRYYDEIMQAVAQHAVSDGGKDSHLYKQMKKAVLIIMDEDRVIVRVRKRALYSIQRYFAHEQAVAEDVLRTTRKLAKFIEKAGKNGLLSEVSETQRRDILLLIQAGSTGLFLREQRLEKFKLAHHELWAALVKKYVLTSLMSDSADVLQQNKAVLDAFCLRLSLLEDDSLVEKIMQELCEYEGGHNVNEALLAVAYQLFPAAPKRDHPFFMQMISGLASNDALLHFFGSAEMQRPRRVEAVAVLETLFSYGSIARTFKRLERQFPNKFSVIAIRLVDAVADLAEIIQNPSVELSKRVWVLQYLRSFFDPFYVGYEHDAQGIGHEKYNLARGTGPFGIAVEFIAVSAMIKQHLNEININFVQSFKYAPDLELTHTIVEIKTMLKLMGLGNVKKGIKANANGQKIIIDFEWMFSQLTKYVARAQKTGQDVLYQLVLDSDFSQAVGPDQLMSKNMVIQMARNLCSPFGNEALKNKESVDQRRSLLQRIGFQIVYIDDSRPHKFFMPDGKRKARISLWDLIQYYHVADELGLY